MPTKPKTDAKSIDGYLAVLRTDQRAALEKLRKVIRSAAPGAEECISYQLAAFRYEGRMLVALGATANHCAFYLMSSTVAAAHKDALKGYDTSKGTIRFQADKPLPAALVRTLVKARIAENKAAVAPKTLSKSPAKRSTNRKPENSERKGAQSDPAVDAFMRTLKHPLKPSLEALRQLILGVNPLIQEGIKWNAPSFRTTEWFATTNVHGKDCLRLILHTGAKAKESAKTGLKIADPTGMLKWLAKDRCLVTLGDEDDVRTRGKALQAIIRQWIASL